MTVKRTGCRDEASCERHNECMYRGCPNHLVGAKIRLRKEYQVVFGKTVLGRYDLLEQARRDFPAADLDSSIPEALAISRPPQGDEAK